MIGQVLLVSGMLLSFTPDQATVQEMRKYGMTAWRYADGASEVRGLLLAPVTARKKPLPLVVYLPGSGEKGEELIRQFRQRTVFDKVTEVVFRRRHPCYLLALSPPSSATTIAGGMPGEPSALQRTLHDFIFALARQADQPPVDLTRVYLTGFSYGGTGAYALALHYPGEFAAVVPISALPPLPEYLSPDHPGAWWHFHNEGDYAEHGIDVRDVESFRDRVKSLGGDFRIGTFPSTSHDAWTSVWREDIMWEWMFSKSLGGKGRPVMIGALPLAKASATVAGENPGCGPDRVLDGLDDTAYVPARPFVRDDWWMVEYDAPIAGKVTLLSGDRQGHGRLKDAVVEVSSNGRSWTRVGSFSAKTGRCSFSRAGKFRFLRVRTSTSAPVSFVLRRLKVVCR